MTNSTVLRRRFAARRLTKTLIFGLMLCAVPSVASAQYFGRNKVQYKNFDFQILKTDHFDIYFYPSEREGIEIAARMAERWHTRLEQVLQHSLRGRQPLVLYASHPDFEQTNTIEGELGEGTGGVTESLRRRIVLPLAGPLADTDHVIGHELVHAFQYDIGDLLRPGPGQGIEALPLWFIEGMAEYVSIGPVDANTAKWLRDAVLQERLPTVEGLDSPDYFPYRWGHAFWAYVAGRWGDRVVAEMLSVGASTGSYRIAIEQVLGIELKQLSTDWQAAISKTYQPSLASTTPRNEIGRLVAGRETGGSINLGPSLSPDGKWIAFLSERGLLSIDLFVADAATGRVRHRLTSSANDPHTSSIQFIHSAGGWDAASQRLAIATVTKGRPALAIYDAVGGDKEREIPLPTLDEIFNPTWAPDGTALCFTGMRGGLTDLYVYDLKTQQLRALTSDPYADLQPAWSPDGRRIAFVTDRFATNLSSLSIGPYRVALVDPATGAIEPFPAVGDSKDINPQWSPDGASLFLIADRGGISNLYRVALSGDSLSQVTNVGTGLSGITETSPALSIASQAGTAAFTVFIAAQYEIYVLDNVNAQAVPVRERSAAAMLPPVERERGEIATLLADPERGLPPPVEYPVEEYSSGLSLEAVSQPSISVGVGSFGPSVGGGLSVRFGDMLGDQVLVAALQLNSGMTSDFSFKNTGAQVSYLNRARRWNWGLIGGQLPYLSGGVQQGVGSINGEPAEFSQSVIFRQTERSVSGLVAYPFNRSQRVEFQGGVSQVVQDQVIHTTAFSLRTGQQLLDETDETSLGDSLLLGTSSAALVFDTTSYGATSPVQGQRYRFEVSPTFGSAPFTGALVDYRRYFMPVPFYTVAARVMHYGRYGSGSADERLRPLYLGYPNLIRGYDLNTIDESECLFSAATACPSVERLMGSRMLVGNLEFRFPLLRPFVGASSRMYGPIPVEVAIFADAGMAWNQGQSPWDVEGRERGVSSVGLSLRSSLFGYGVGQFDLSRPLQRPGQGWVFQFSLTPGF